MCVCKYKYIYRYNSMNVYTFWKLETLFNRRFSRPKTGGMTGDT